MHNVWETVEGEVDDSTTEEEEAQDHHTEMFERKKKKKKKIYPDTLITCISIYLSGEIKILD